MKRIFLSLLFVVTLFTTLSSCSSKCKHDYSDPTCLNPSICQKCGEIDGEALGHKWTDATCTKAKTCSVCRLTDGNVINHTWVEATCETPQKCMVCDAIGAPALEHTGGIVTCTTDGICITCGATYINRRGHQYDQEVTSDEYICSTATCTQSAKYFYSCLCGESGTEFFAFGSPIDHNWKDATCTVAQKCSSCGETSGKKLGHTYSSVVKQPTCTNQGYTIHTCLRCGDNYTDHHTQVIAHKFYNGVCTVCGQGDPQFYELANDAYEYLKKNLVYPHSLELMWIKAGVKNGYIAVKITYSSLTASGKITLDTKLYMYTMAGTISSNSYGSFGDFEEYFEIDVNDIQIRN